MLKLANDLKRVVSITEDLLFLAGRSLQRRAFRNGFILALAYGSALMGVKVAGAQQLTSEQVFTLLIIAFASYPAGALLVHIANFLTRGNLSAAAAGHMHLTSHFKQANMRQHLIRMWDEVFSLESAVKRPLDEVIDARARFSSLEVRIRRFLGDIPDDIQTDLSPIKDVEQFMHRLLSAFVHEPENMEATKDLFLLSATYALSTPAPLLLQNKQIGFNISPLEDWYEKGIFTYEDYPKKAFGRDPHIQKIKQLVEPSWRYYLMHWIAPEPVASFWYSLTARKYGVLIGKGIRELNANTPEDTASLYFDAQHFLWPSRELDEAVLRDFGDQGEVMLRMLNETRQRSLSELFSNDRVTARHHVSRLFVREFKQIFLLRLRFDVEFSAGVLSNTPISELQDLENRYYRVRIKPQQLEKFRNDALEALENTNSICADLSDKQLSKEQIRTLAIAHFINLNDIETGYKNSDFKQQYTQVLDQTRRMSELLVRLRCYYCLTKLHIDTYWHVIKKLSKFN